MKWNEAVFRALGEIDDDLIPDESSDPEPSKSEKKNRHAGRKALTAFGSAAAILLIVSGIFLFPRLTGAETAADDTPSGFVPLESIPDPAACNPHTMDYLPYLSSYAEEFIPMERFLTIPAPPEAEPSPQTFEADEADSVPLPEAFAGRDGAVWQAIGGNFETEDALFRNLRRDAGYANFTRSYGCVLWRADWDPVPAEAEYAAVVPLLGPDETLSMLAAGEYVTDVPEDETPRGIETLIGRRTLVYLLSPAENWIRLYECFFVRLNPDEDNAPRWGLYYVPAAEVPADD